VVEPLSSGCTPSGIYLTTHGKHDSAVCRRGVEVRRTGATRGERGFGSVKKRATPASCEPGQASRV